MQGWVFESMENRRFLRQLNLMTGHKTPASCEAKLVQSLPGTDKSESSKLAFCSQPQNPFIETIVPRRREEKLKHREVHNENTKHTHTRESELAVAAFGGRRKHEKIEKKT